MKPRLFSIAKRTPFLSLSSSCHISLPQFPLSLKLLSLKGKLIHLAFKQKTHNHKGIPMKQLIALMTLSTLLTSTTALADYGIYGKASLGVLSNNPDGGKSNTNIKSFASRIGIKGDTELTDGLKAVYRWESEVDLTGSNAGDTSLLKARNQYLGLKGNFGTIIGGINDTPMKQAEGKIDLYSDIIDIARVQDPYMDTQEREKDSLGYYSPKFNKLQFGLATMPGKGDSLGDAYSTSLIYGDKKLKSSSFFGAIAYDSGVDETEDSSAIRISGASKFGALKVGAIYEQADTGRATAETQGRYIVSGKYNMGRKNTLLLQYAKSEDANNGIKDVAGSTDTSIGISHKLGKKTSAYVTFNIAENVKGTKGDDEKNAIVGIVHKFSLK